MARTCGHLVEALCRVQWPAEVKKKESGMNSMPNRVRTQTAGRNILLQVQSWLYAVARCFCFWPGHNWLVTCHWVWYGIGRGLGRSLISPRTCSHRPVLGPVHCSRILRMAPKVPLPGAALELFPGSFVFPFGALTLTWIFRASQDPEQRLKKVPSR